MIDFDNAIKVAYEFYKKHPKETLIVITADHETGGIGLGARLCGSQPQSPAIPENISRIPVTINKLRKEKNHKVSWEEVKALLADKMGLWKELPVSWEQEKKLRDEYENSFVKRYCRLLRRQYAISEPLAARAKEVVNEIARVAWASGNHSASTCPCLPSVPERNYSAVRWTILKSQTHSQSRRIQIKKN
ncbi:MAG: alkaline phosphatase [Bacteroides graminisolvens]